MRIIFKIAKAEIRNLFYSPIAWLIIIAFYVLCGYQFVSPLVDLARIQEANTENNLNYSFSNSLSVSIFSKSIANVLENLYLFIPLLTMGVINREASSGSLKLLYSSPIRTRDIVLGKYLGLMVFNFILVLIVAILFATGYFAIVNAQLLWYMAIVLAIFLLVNAYVAIGVFMSSLSTYQLVAAILTFMVFFLLQYLNGVGQDYDFFRDLTYFLTMKNKAEIMINGLISSRDILYFILITTLFLGFTIIKLKSTQESRTWKVSFFRYTSLFLMVMLLGYFSSRPGYVGYWDVTRNKQNTIHPAVENVFKKLDGSPLTVTLYTNLIGRGLNLGIPRSRNNYVWDYWDLFIRSYPNIKLKYEYYYDISDNDKQIKPNFPGKTIHQIALIFANLFNVDISLFRKEGEINKLVDLSEEDYGLILELEYKGKKAFARTYQDDLIVPSQTHIAATLLRLIDKTPKVIFTTDHYERNPNSLGERGYSAIFNDKLARNALINNGVDTDTLSLMINDIPERADVLVVADPKSVYSENEKNKIMRYLNQGGNAFIMGEPGKQSIVNELLKETGAKLDNGIIVFPRNKQVADLIPLTLTPTGHYLSDEASMYLYRVSGIPSGMSANTVANLSYSEINNFKIEPIYDFTISAPAWLETGLYVADSAAPVYSPMEGDIKKRWFVAGLKLSRTINNKEQRIVVSGDADNWSNRDILGVGVANGIMSWLMYNKYPVYANVAPPVDLNVKISFSSSRLLFVSYVYGIPSLLLLTGIILLIRRKRK